MMEGRWWAVTWYARVNRVAAVASLAVSHWSESEPGKKNEISSTREAGWETMGRGLYLLSDKYNLMGHITVPES